MINFYKHILDPILICIPLWVSAQPEIVPNGPLEFCYGDSVMLCVNQEYSAYLWNSNAVGQCIKVLESGEYFPIMLDSDGNIDSTLVSSPVSVIVHTALPYVGIINDSIFVNEHFESYQWYMNNSLMVGETDSFLVPTVSAYYHVVVMDDFGCIGSSPFFSPPFPFPPPNGINEYTRFSFQILPNPVSDQIVITVLNGQFAQTVLLDARGREVGRFQPMGGQRMSMDLNGLATGVYLIDAELDDGRRSVQRVVVNGP